MVIDGEKKRLIRKYKNLRNVNYIKAPRIITLSSILL